MANRNQGIDIAKFIAALFVVGIHTRPLSDWSATGDFLLCDILFRTAVPFFVLCTGYYLTRKWSFSEETGLLEDSEANLKLYLRTAWKFLVMYVGWSLFYLVILSFTWYQSGSLSAASYTGWIKSFLTGGSFYHLWYPFELLVAVLLAGPVLGWIPKKFIVPVILIFWVVGASLYVSREFTSVLSHFEGATFRILPLLLLGSLIARHPSECPSRVSLLGALAFLALLTVEAVLLRRNGETDYSYILMTLPLAYCVFLSVKDAKVAIRTDTKTLADASMVMYFIHPAFISFLKAFGGVRSPMVLFLSSMALAIVAGLLYARYRHLKRMSL